MTHKNIVSSSLWRDREIWIFLVLIVLANAAFVYSISEGLLSMRLYNKGRFLLLGLILVCVVFAFRRLTGAIGLLAPLTVWRVKPVWFLVAALWPPTISLLTLTGKGLLLGTGLSEVQATLEVVTSRSVLPTLLLSAFIGEIVWVGYAIARLKQHTSILLASLVIGVFWSLWWLPIVLIGIGVVPGIPVTALFINMTGVAVMCGFIYAQTRSGLAVLTLQLCFNGSLLVFPVSPDTGGVATFWAFITLYLSGALLMHRLFGPRPLWALPR